MGFIDLIKKVVKIAWTLQILPGTPLGSTINRIKSVIDVVASADEIKDTIIQGGLGIGDTWVGEDTTEETKAGTTQEEQNFLQTSGDTGFRGSAFFKNEDNENRSLVDAVVRFKGVSTTTDGVGNWVLSNTPLGEGDLTISKEGFKTVHIPATAEEGRNKAIAMPALHEGTDEIPEFIGPEIPEDILDERRNLPTDRIGLLAASLAALGRGEFDLSIELFNEATTLSEQIGSEEADELMMNTILVAMPATKVTKLKGVVSPTILSRITSFFTQSWVKTTAAITAATAAAKATAGGVVSVLFKDPKTGALSARAVGKTTLGVGTTLAGIDVLAVWLASDNVITGAGFSVRKLKEAVKEGVITKAEALEHVKRVEGWVEDAAAFVETSVKLNPTLVVFKTPFLINNEKGKLDIMIEKLRLQEVGELSPEKQIILNQEKTVKQMVIVLESKEDEKRVEVEKFRINRKQDDLKIVEREGKLKPTEEERERRLKEDITFLELKQLFNIQIDEIEINLAEERKILKDLKGG